MKVLNVSPRSGRRIRRFVFRPTYLSRRAPFLRRLGKKFSCGVALCSCTLLRRCRPSSRRRGPGTSRKEK